MRWQPAKAEAHSIAFTCAFGHGAVCIICENKYSKRDERKKKKEEKRIELSKWNLHYSMGIYVITFVRQNGKRQQHFYCRAPYAHVHSTFSVCISKTNRIFNCFLLRGSSKVECIFCCWHWCCIVTRIRCSTLLSSRSDCVSTAFFFDHKIAKFSAINVKFIGNFYSIACS